MADYTPILKSGFTGTRVTEKGIVCRYVDGKLHACDQPAVEYPSGKVFWYKDGQKHRDGDEPAAIWKNGTRIWYKNGKRHRDKGPAVITTYYPKKREWYWRGYLHREDGPAVVCNETGFEGWYAYGEAFSGRYMTPEKRAAHFAAQQAKMEAHRCRLIRGIVNTTFAVPSRKAQPLRVSRKKPPSSGTNP